MTTTRIALTRKAHLVLDMLDARDGRKLRPGFGPCPGCDETCAVWDGAVLCMTRTDSGHCPGNGKPPRRAEP